MSLLRKLKIDERTFYEMISLYEYTSLFGLLFLTIASQNSYLGALTIALLTKQIPEKFMKHQGYKLVDKMLNTKHSVNDRPEDAYDCNMINKGGDASMNPGFPSGHSIVASFIFFTVLFEARYLKKNLNKNMYGLLIITGLFLFLVPYARYKIGCHTQAQVIGGIVTGLLWAMLFRLVEQKILMKNKKYVDDKIKVLCNFTD